MLLCHDGMTSFTSVNALDWNLTNGQLLKNGFESNSVTGLPIVICAEVVGENRTSRRTVLKAKHANYF